MMACDRTVENYSDNEGSVVSVSSHGAPSTGNRKISRTKPNCNKCKNHGFTVRLSGHKRYCKYIDCKCQPCVLTDERRTIMAAQTRQKRAQVQDEVNKVPYPLRAPVHKGPPLPPSPSSRVSVHSSPPLSPPSPPPPPPRQPVATPPKYDIIDSARRLISEFNMSESVLPFAVVILKKIGHYDCASKILFQIQGTLIDKTRLTASLVHDHTPLSSLVHKPRPLVTYDTRTPTNLMHERLLMDRQLPPNGHGLHERLVMSRMVQERPPIFAHGPNYVPGGHPSIPFKVYTGDGDCGALSLVHPNRAH